MSCWTEEGEVCVSPGYSSKHWARELAASLRSFTLRVLYLPEKPCCNYAVLREWPEAWFPKPVKLMACEKKIMCAWIKGSTGDQRTFTFKKNINIETTATTTAANATATAPGLSEQLEKILGIVSPKAMSAFFLLTIAQLTTILLFSGPCFYVFFLFTLPISLVTTPNPQAPLK